MTLRIQGSGAGDVRIIAPAESSTFDVLSDTPSSKTGNSLKLLRVNLGELSIEYLDPSTDFLTQYLLTDGSRAITGALETSHGSILANADVSGVLTLGGVGGTYNASLLINFEQQFGGVLISQSGGPFDTITFGSPLRLNDDIDFIFGNNADVRFRWDEEVNGSFKMGLNVGGVNGATGYYLLTELADMSSANRIPDADWVNGATPADPTFCVTSSDATNKLDHGCQWHDQTDYNIVSGAGDINIIAAVDVKLNPTAAGNVTFFEDTDVDNAVDGKFIYVYRKAAEGDNNIRFHIDQARQAYIRTDSAVLKLKSIALVESESNFAIANQYLGSGQNPTSKHYGYITADTSSKFINWQVNDVTDNFELTREDGNIGAFDVQMPLIATTVTVGSTTLTEQNLIDLLALL